jgi:hypothetical protein
MLAAGRRVFRLAAARRPGILARVGETRRWGRGSGSAGSAAAGSGAAESVRFRRRRWIALAATSAVAGLAVLALASLLSARLVRVATGEPGYPLWDPAAHGLAGLDLADALRAGDPLAALRVLNACVTWPFVHALLLVPGFLILGNGYATGDVVSAVLFGAAAVALFAAGLALHPRRGAWLGAAAAVLLLLAPAYRLYGTLTMLEIPGALLLAVALGWLARAGSPGEPSTRRSRFALGAAGLASAALFLTKYNYGLLWLLPLALHEATGSSSAGAREALAGARAWLRGRAWLRPFPLFVAAYALFLVAIVVTGGWDVVVAGRSVSIHSPGNPAYFLYLILLARLAARWARRPASLREAWRALPPRARILLGTAGAPLALWFAIPVPNRVSALADFIRNRSDAVPLGLLDRLAFYPRAFVSDYAPGPAIGAAVLLLALVPPLRTRRGDSSRLVYLAMWVGLLASTLHGYHQSRFLFTTALLVWLSAAGSAVSLAERALARPAVPAPFRRALWGAALAALVAWGAWGGPSDGWLRAAHRGSQSGAALRPVLDWVADQVAREPGGTVLLGENVRLSPALVAWRLRLVSPALRRASPARAAAPAPGADRAASTARADHLLRRFPRVLAVLPVPGGELVDDALLAETRGDSLTVARMREIPGVAASAWAEFPEAGYRAVRLARHAPSAAP